MAAALTSTLHRRSTMPALPGRPLTRLLNRRTPRGFTLIELLVVVVTTAVMFGVLLPPVVKVRLTVRQHHCVFDFEEIQAAQREYRTTHPMYAASLGQLEDAGLLDHSLGQ